MRLPNAATKVRNREHDWVLFLFFSIACCKMSTLIWLSGISMTSIGSSGFGKGSAGFGSRVYRVSGSFFLGGGEGVCWGSRGFAGSRVSVWDSSSENGDCNLLALLGILLTLFFLPMNL